MYLFNCWIYIIYSYCLASALFSEIYPSFLVYLENKITETVPVWIELHILVPIINTIDNGVCFQQAPKLGKVLVRMSRFFLIHMQATLPPVTSDSPPLTFTSAWGRTLPGHFLNSKWWFFGSKVSSPFPMCLKSYLTEENVLEKNWIMNLSRSLKRPF